MPELPEVETVCRGLKNELVGETISSILVREHRLRWRIPEILSTLPLVHPLKIREITRRAKYLLISTQKGTLIIHLGMSGRISLIPQSSIRKQNLAVGKHDHVDFNLKNGKILRYTDPRRFGAILWTEQDPYIHKLLNKLGPEPLSKEFSAHYLFQRAHHRKTMIKQLIMNANVVVGVGNIYANEALFAANILPTRRSHTLSLMECQRLTDKIKVVLEKAIKAGGTTLKDFANPKGKPGYFVQKLSVYGKEGELCPSCNKQILAIRIGLRSTFYCKFCQV